MAGEYRRRGRLLGAFGVVAVLAAGCGGGQGNPQGTGGTNAAGGRGGGAGAGQTGGAGRRNDGGPQADGGPDALVLDPALQTFCQAVRGLLVSHLQTCGGSAPVIAQQLQNIDPCVAWGTGVVAGTMVFDATDASACVTALGSLACDADALPSICSGVLRGLVQPGSPCNVARQLALFGECEAGAACVPGGDNACLGTCTARGLLNQPCTNAPCVAGETCNLNTGLCALKGSLGDPCGASGILVCGPGLFCTDITSAGSCAAQQATGTCAAENLQSSCAPPAQCNAGLALSGTCGPAVQPGAPCTIEEFDCPVGLHCSAAATCQPNASIGQPCNVTTDGEEISCVVGLCDTSAGTGTGVCKTSGPGGSCLVNADCGPNALCAPGSLGAIGCTAPCF